MERRRKRDKNTRKSTVPRKQSLLENEDCIICFEKVSCRGKLSVCDHWFCFCCIHEWSKNTNTCPVCKKKFRCISKTNLRHGKSPVRKFRVSDVDQRAWNDDDEMSVDNHGDSYNGETSGNDSSFVITDDENWWTASSEDSFNFTSSSSSSESSFTIDNSFDKHLDNSFDKHLDNIHNSDDSSSDDDADNRQPSAMHTTSRARFHCPSKSRQKASDRQFKKAAKRTESALLQKKKREKAPSQATSSTRRNTRSESTVTTSSSTWTSSQSTSILLSSTRTSTQHASATSFSTRTSIQTASTALSSRRRSGQRATTRSSSNSGLWLNATRGRPFSSQTTKKSNKKSRTRDKKPVAEAHCSTRAANDPTPSPQPTPVTRKHKSRANKLFDSDSESSDDQVKATNMRSKRIFSLFFSSPEASPDKQCKKKRWVLRERQNYQFE